MEILIAGYIFGVSGTLAMLLVGIYSMGGFDGAAEAYGKDKVTGLQVEWAVAAAAFLWPIVIFTLLKRRMQ